MGSVEQNNKDFPDNSQTESDSGMASLQDSSKDVTPENTNKPIVNDDSDDEDIEDETLGERLWGLTEMFPETLVNGTSRVVTGTISGAKGIFKLSKSLLWIFFSSSVILVAPLLFEVERAQLIETQRSQEKQLLLGAGGGMPSNLGPGIAMMPTR
uniref:Mitochondrial import receptor subunit TOM22 homolog n=1 Tax=Clastoptera arizonana TaxID=38151 RepID=A0A1B6EGX2_9HEMI